MPHLHKLLLLSPVLAVAACAGYHEPTPDCLEGRCDDPSASEHREEVLACEDEVNAAFFDDSIDIVEAMANLPGCIREANDKVAPMLDAAFTLEVPETSLPAGVAIGLFRDHMVCQQISAAVPESDEEEQMPPEPACQGIMARSLADAIDTFVEFPGFDMLTYRDDESRMSYPECFDGYDEALDASADEAETAEINFELSECIHDKVLERGGWVALAVAQKQGLDQQGTIELLTTTSMDFQNALVAVDRACDALAYGGRNASDENIASSDSSLCEVMMKTRLGVLIEAWVDEPQLPE